ncbi:MAG: hypothetical protein HPY79_06275 [Bacteroidales bacterium]|nr:hypothetical protein [Bacteroidales bacterium]
MTHKHVFSLLTIVLLAGFSFSQPKPSFYKNQWRKVDSLENKGMVKSALELVLQIQKNAKAENNVAQVVKTRIYQLKYRNIIEEDAFEKILTEMSNESYQAPFPYSSLYHSLCAELYWQYYQNNRYRFYNRTYSSDESNDMRTWSLTHLTDVAIKHYLKSLEEKEKLQKTPLKNFQEILTYGENSENLRPTLYDFLAFRAVTFFTNKELTLSRPIDAFELDDSTYFTNAQSFIQQKIKSNDTLSLQFYGIKILQDILAFHINDAQPDAFIDADLNRLDFVYKNTILENKDQLYINALQQLFENYKTFPYSNAIAYQLCLQWSLMSQQYNAFDSSTYMFKTYKTKAYQFAQECINRHPKALYSQHLKNFMEGLENQTLIFEVEETAIPNKPFAIKLTYTNITKAFISVRSIDKNKYQELVYKEYGEKLINTLVQESKEVYKKTTVFPDDKDFNTHSVEEILSGLPQGYYVVIVSGSENLMDNNATRCYQKLVVTNLAMISNRQEDGSYKIVVTNRESGKPIPNTQVILYKYVYGQTKDHYVKGNTYITDNNGMVTVLTPDDPFRKKNDGSLYIEIKTDNESLMSNQSFYSYYYNQRDDMARQQITLFTDRAIYRPGQTVYFKGIVITSKGKSREIAPNYPVNISLRDVNYQVVDEIQKISNDFGTFSGSFKIPEGLLNGMFTLHTNEGSINIRVEEYKRPKFFVTVEPNETEYVLGDSITVKASVKSYAGVPLQGIPVKFRVIRVPRWRGYWYWYRPQTPPTEIASGTIKTNDSGFVFITFKAIPDNHYPINESSFYNYQVTVDATDINNETQSSSVTVSAGAVSLFFNLAVSDIMTHKEIEKILFKVENSNGIKIQANGSYKITKLQDPVTLNRNRLWTVPDKKLYTREEWEKIFPHNEYDNPLTIYQYKELQTLYSGTFDTKTDTVLAFPLASTWLPGAYVIELTAKDSKGKDVHHKEYFTLFAPEQGKQVPQAVPLFIKASKQQYKPGETANITLGSAFDEAQVLMGMSYFDSPETYRWITLKNKQQTVIEIPIEEKHRGNVYLSFLMIQNNRVYQQNISIYVPFDNKELKITTETFRSKIYPGQKETWRLKITGPQGEKVNAELLASMYDKSLDAFIGHNWSFNPYPYFYQNMYFAADQFSLLSGNCYQSYKNYTNIPSITYPQLDWFGFYYSYGSYRNGGHKSARYTTSRLMDSPGKADTKEAEEVVDAMLPATAKSLSEQTVATEKDNSKKQEEKGGMMSDIENNTTLPTIRKNLNETAFFLPDLKTDVDGNVVFSFDAPEALTTWKFMSFAVSKDLKYGFYQNECITQKEMMVTPQLPRFFREGDSLQIFIKVDNLSDNEQKIKVRLHIENALANQNNLVLKDEKDIVIKPKRSDVVSFTFNVPSHLALVKVTSLAQGVNFSDGEEVMLPVLPNRMLVTESLPFYVRGKQQKQIDFKRIKEASQSSTLTHESLTLEYTANPIWYAVMAIPYLRSFPYECNEQLFNRYYANKLSQYIVNAIPNFNNVFNEWLKDTVNNPLNSPLSKNQELKSVVLAETPWVEESMDETSQRHDIALYFDKKRINNELRQAASKLIKNQYPNGSWSWFPGMPESRYITQYIVASNGRLEKSYQIDSDLQNAMSKAIVYLDRQIEKDYNELKRYTRKEDLDKYHISYFQVHYLYARSFYLNKNKGFLQSEAYQYFYGQAKKYWINMSEYMQGMIALAMNRSNDIETAKTIIKSLQERTVESEEQGMYWKTISRGLSWYESPIEAHSLLIEAFNEISKDYKVVNELKLWLLLQKQTQNWKTTTATADAIHALLFTGTTEMTTTFDAEIIWGNKPVKISKSNVEVATGHIKEKIERDKISDSYAQINVENKGNDISWGAIHWQYFENLDKISGYESNYMSLKREYYLEKITPSGKVLEPINPGSTLKIGDVVIVRLVLECDRNLEYVHLKDMRPSSFEPMQTLSGYFYKDGLGYYGETKDASYNFFFDYMPRGKYVLEYSLRVSQKGKFSTGISTLQCMYAPEFNAHAQGMLIKVK